MTKYIVSGYIGFDNFGDEAIQKVLTEKLKSKNAEKITLISHNPTQTAKNFGVDSCGMFKFLKPLIEADVLISGGGSLLQDVTSLKSLIYYLGVIFCALLLRKKIYIYAQGIGPVNSKFGQILTKIILKKCHQISVRDKKSQDLLKSWNINSELVSDPILEIQLEPKHLKGKVGVQLRDFSTLNDEFLHNLAKEVCKIFSDKEIEVISLQDEIDLKICEKFAEYLKSEGVQNVKILHHLLINDVFNIISELEYLIAMRFHANVVGIKSGVKTMAINYDIKVKKLAEEYNLPIININEQNLSSIFKNFIAI